MRNNWVGVPGRESSWVLSIGEAVRAVAWVIWCRLVHMCCCVLLGGSRTYHHRHLLEEKEMRLEQEVHVGDNLGVDGYMEKW